MNSLTQPDAQVLSLEEQVVRLEALLEAARRVHSSIASEAVAQEATLILVRELEMEGAAFVNTGGALLAEAGQMAGAPWAGCPRFVLEGRTGGPLAELVVSAPGGRELSEGERAFIERLVLQTAVALENALLHERDVEWARVASDLDAARTIQRSLLPAAMPVMDGYSIAARSDTCYEVGGDYLDVLPLPGGAYLLVVADVAGKGLASAMVATSFRSAFRLLATQGLPLEEMAARVNDLHWAEGAEARRRYVTAILVRLDPAAESVEIVNAGHNPGMLSGPEGVTQVEASATPLGLLPHARYQAERRAFPPGASLLLYTDGLTEVFCGEEEFGCERLAELFAASAPGGAKACLESIWKRVRNFSAGEAQTDDMTALVICHKLAVSEEPYHA